MEKATELQKELKELVKHIQHLETEEGQKEIQKNLEDFNKYLAEMMRK
jgi:hypothetical protein